MTCRDFSFLPTTWPAEVSGETGLSYGELALGPDDAVVVCFLHSYAFPDHEQRAAAVLRAYVRRIPIVRPHVEAGPHDDLAAFAAIAARHPVFVIERIGGAAPDAAPRSSASR